MHTRQSYCGWVTRISWNMWTICVWGLTPDVLFIKSYFIWQPNRTAGFILRWQAQTISHLRMNPSFPWNLPHRYAYKNIEGVNWTYFFSFYHLAVLLQDTDLFLQFEIVLLKLSNFLNKLTDVFQVAQSWAQWVGLMLVHLTHRKEKINQN